MGINNGQRPFFISSKGEEFLASLEDLIEENGWAISLDLSELDALYSNAKSLLIVLGFDVLRADEIARQAISTGIVIKASATSPGGWRDYSQAPPPWRFRCDKCGVEKTTSLRLDGSKCKTLVADPGDFRDLEFYDNSTPLTKRKPPRLCGGRWSFIAGFRKEGGGPAGEWVKVFVRNDDESTD